MESPHYSYSITPQAKGAYASESKEVVDTLYIRISSTTNGRFFRVGTVDSSWKKLKQLFHSAFSSDKYLRGEEAKRYVSAITDHNCNLNSRMINETTGSIYYTSRAEENLTQVDGPDAPVGNLYMRIHHHKDASGIERTTYKAGSAETTWKKIKHWFKNAFPSTKYLYGFAARKEIYTIKDREQLLLDRGNEAKKELDKVEYSNVHYPQTPLENRDSESTEKSTVLPKFQSLTKSPSQSASTTSPTTFPQATNTESNKKHLAKKQKKLPESMPNPQKSGANTARSQKKNGQQATGAFTKTINDLPPDLTEASILSHPLLFAGHSALEANKSNKIQPLESGRILACNDVLVKAEEDCPQLIDSSCKKNTYETPKEEDPLFSMTDSCIARNFLYDDLNLLKEDGAYFQALQKEIEQIKDQPLKLQTFQSALTILKKYYHEVNNTPQTDPNLNKNLKEAISGLDLLISNIQQIKTAEVKGIANITNSCYLNTAMQMLRSTSTFMQALIDLNLDTLEDDAELKMVIKAREFFEAYKNQNDSASMEPYATELRQALFEAKVIDAPEEAPVDLDAIKKLLKELTAGASGEAAAEMYAFLTSSLQQVQNPLAAQNDTIVILDAFIRIVGQPLSTVEIKKSINSDYKAIRAYDKPTNLLVCLPQAGAHQETLKGLINTRLSSRLNFDMQSTYLFPPILSDLDEGANNTPFWGQETKFTEAPKYILVQLNRLTSVERNGVWIQEHNNATISVDPNEVFDLSQFCESKETAKYRLVSAGQHHKNGSGGHYTAIVREGDAWIACDDAVVKALDQSQVQAELGKHYIYMLEKIS